MERRNFLQQSTALATGSLLTNIISSSALANISFNRRKRIAIVGTGVREIVMWGIPVIKEFGDMVEFVGLCDLNPGRVETAK